MSDTLHYGNVGTQLTAPHGAIDWVPEVKLRQWALEQTKETYRSLDVAAWIRAADDLIAYVKEGKRPA